MCTVKIKWEESLQSFSLKCSVRRTQPRECIFRCGSKVYFLCPAQVCLFPVQALVVCKPDTTVTIKEENKNPPAGSRLSSEASSHLRSNHTWCGGKTKIYINKYQCLHLSLHKENGELWVFRAQALSEPAFARSHTMEIVWLQIHATEFLCFYMESLQKKHLQEDEKILSMFEKFFFEFSCFHDQCFIVIFRVFNKMQLVSLMDCMSQKLKSVYLREDNWRWVCVTEQWS